MMKKGSTVKIIKKNSQWKDKVGEVIYVAEDDFDAPLYKVKFTFTNGSGEDKPIIQFFYKEDIKEIKKESKRPLKESTEGEILDGIGPHVVLISKDNGHKIEILRQEEGEVIVRDLNAEDVYELPNEMLTTKYFDYAEEDVVDDEDFVYDILVDDDYLEPEELFKYNDGFYEIDDIETARKVRDLVQKDYPDSKVEIQKHYWNANNSFKNEIVEDTIKTKSGKWVNKGDNGETHGEFKTKKAADAQRKAMFANGYRKNGGNRVMARRKLKEDFVAIEGEEDALDIFKDYVYIEDSNGKKIPSWIIIDKIATAENVCVSDLMQLLYSVKTKYKIYRIDAPNFTRMVVAAPQISAKDIQEDFADYLLGKSIVTEINTNIHN